MRIRIWPQYISSMKTKLKSQRKIHQRLAETADKENLCTHYCRTNRVKTDAAATSSDTRIHYTSVNLKQRNLQSLVMWETTSKMNQDHTLKFRQTMLTVTSGSLQRPNIFDPPRLNCGKVQNKYSIFSPHTSSYKREEKQFDLPRLFRLCQ